MKNLNLIIYIVLGVVLIILFVLGFYFYQQFYSSNDNQADIPIENQFDGKIVYTTNTSLEQGPFRQDCLDRGGQFNPCGSICAPGTDICIELCAYTCTFDQDENNDQSQNDNDQSGQSEWDTYRSQELSFTIEYPDYIEVEERNGSVSFIKWGPTQRGGTELYDGISLTVRGLDIATDSSPLEFAQEEIVDAQMLGEVISEIATSTFANQEAYVYTVRTLGISSKIVLSLDDNENYDALQITYSSPDPENIGHEEVVEKMLESFDIVY